MPNDLSSPPRILFIDDDADVQKAAAMLLPRRGFALVPAANPEEAWSVLAAEPVDVVLLDLNFRPGAHSGDEGLRALDALIQQDPDRVVVVVTGHSGINIAVAAMRAGAADFVMKPWSNDRLVATLNDAVALRRRRLEARLRGGETPPATEEETPVIGESPAMRRALDLVRRTAPTDAPILLLGEAGTGKSLLAHMIHLLSPRAGRKLATIEPGAIWSEGEAAFAASLGAVDGEATLFLDEIGGLPARLQARLLGFLKDHPRLRLVAATRQARNALQNGLHPDLLYRLNTVELVLPPLRERREDVKALAEHYLRLFARRYHHPGLVFSPEAEAAMAAHPWPGNVRALRQAVERAVVLASGDLLAPEDIVPDARPPEIAAATPDANDLNLARSEKAMVEAALRRHGFNVSHAAKELGLTRAALYRRMARHGL